MLRHALLVFLTVSAAGAAALAASPAWILARPGTAAYIGADDGDVPRGVVCPTAALYQRHVKEHDASGCKEPRQGTPVVITAVTPVGDDTRAMLKIRAVDGAFSGYTGLYLLEPAIPRGLGVSLKPAASEKLTLATSQHRDLEVGLDLGSSASARVVRYDPSIGDGRDLQVVITAGHYSGKIGWLYARQASLHDASPINVLQI